MMTLSLADQVTRLRAAIAAARTAGGVTMSPLSADHLDHGLSLLAESARAVEAEADRLRWAAGAATDAAHNAGCSPTELVMVLRDLSVALRDWAEGRIAPAAALAASHSIALMADRVERADRVIAARAACAQREADETLIEAIDAGRVVLFDAGVARSSGGAS